MNNKETVKKAIFNLGGPKIAGGSLKVAPGTINRWIRRGVIPNLNKAKQVARESGFDVELLRPRFEQAAV